MPCSLTKAVSLASSNPLRFTVSAAAGNYDEGVIVATGLVSVVAPGATFRGKPSGSSLYAVLVGSAGRVTIRGATIETVGTSSYNGGVGDAEYQMGGTLNLIDVTVVATNANRLYYTAGGGGELLRVRFRGTDAIGSTVAIVNQGATIKADQLRVESANTKNATVLISDGGAATITNAMFENGFLQVDAGGSLDLAFSTFVLGATFSAVYSYTNDARIENNIIVTGSGSAVTCPGCVVERNVLFPAGPATLGTNRVADPKFISATDRRLKPDSPAIDTAVPSTELSTTHDHDGVMRPQGAAHDVGAFERTP